MTYTVAAGDTLAKIAAKFLGDPMRYRELAAYNGISDPNLIRVGQVIRIPSATVSGTVVKSSVPLVPTPLIQKSTTVPSTPTPLLPVPVTAAPRVSTTSSTGVTAAPIEGQSLIQRLMANKKLLIMLAVGAGLLFYMQSQSKRGKTALG